MKPLCRGLAAPTSPSSAGRSAICASPAGGATTCCSSASPTTRRPRRSPDAAASPVSGGGGHALLCRAVSADGDDSDVVGGAADVDQVSQEAVDESVQRRGPAGGGRGGQPVQAGVEVLVAAFDEAVGEQQQRRADRQ